MENLISKASSLKYNALEYVDYEDIENALVSVNNNECIFLYQKWVMKKEVYWESKSINSIQLFWAANSKDVFFEGLGETIDQIKEVYPDTDKMYIEFIPEAFLDDMSSRGFRVVSEWVDFWKRDLTALHVKKNDSLNIRLINGEEISIVGAITRNCKGYSRGFTGQTDGCIKEWSEAENSYLFVAEQNGEVVGMCYVILYGFDSEKGTVIWIREVAVDPKYQAKGIGRALILHGIMCGKEHGAKRSFLACDTENFNAIKLYESLGYSRNDERGQINMELILR